MDVPSWHPANQNADAARRLAMSGGDSTARTEFKEVDTSTEAEREMVDKEESAVLGGGRGFLDPSDRMYLVEQRQLEQQANNRERMERQVALQSFRSNALKMQTQKPEVPMVAMESRKKSLQPREKKTVVVIKAKKRQATTAEKETKLKKTKKSPVESVERARTLAKTVKKQENNHNGDATAKTKPPATALLLQDYSSSSDEG